MMFRALVRQLPVLGPVALKTYELWKRGPKRKFISLEDTLVNLYPNSDGRRSALAELLLSTTNSLPDSFQNLQRAISGDDSEVVVSLDRFASKKDLRTSSELKRLFSGYGSDKASHRYHLLYAGLFERPAYPKLVVEIGIGTNNEKVVSHMGRNHKGSGGSLRAFRDFFETANVVGLDIDPTSFFQETRIACHLYDQTGGMSQLLDLGLERGTVDLFVDDGLHLFGANLNSLVHMIDMVRPGGFGVVEDITDRNVGLWLAPLFMLRSQGFDCEIIACSSNTNAFLFRKPLLLAGA